jgi:RNA polymerase sigma-70 factor (ECF subfamily)
LELSDNDIVQNVLRGRENDFSLLFVKYKRVVLLEALKLWKDYQELDDISQEVFLRVFKSLALFDPKYRIGTWIAAVTRNYCKVRLRQKRILPKGSDMLEHCAETWQCGLTTEETALRNEAARQVREAVMELPDAYRTPVVLYYFKGCSYGEIASLLNVPLSIVKNRLYRARNILRAKMEDS